MFAYSVQKGGNERKTKCLHRRQERLTYEVVAGVKSLFTSPYTHTHTLLFGLQRSLIEVCVEEGKIWLKDKVL